MADTTNDPQRQIALAANQSLFWKGHLLSPDSPIYNTAWKFHLFLDLDEAVFVQAFNDIASASDAMRAVFVEIDQTPMQRLAPTVQPHPAALDLTGEQDPEGALTKWFDQWVAEPFDLGKCSYRTQLLELGAGHWVWCFAQHHIATDAQAGAALLRAVSDRYVQIMKGQALETLHLPSYFDVVERWARAREPSPDLPESRSSRIEATLPYDAHRSGGHSSVRVDFGLEPSLKEKLSRFSSDPANRLITPALGLFATYLTAYVAFLHRTSGNERISLGVPSHNRFSTEDKATLGLFVEVLPMEFEIDPNETFGSLHLKVRDEIGAFLRKARPNAVLSVSESGVTGVLNFMQARFDTFAGAPLEVEMCHSGAHDAQHGLRLHVMDFDGSGQHSLAFDINQDILQCTSCDMICSHFRNILGSLVAAPDGLLSEAKMCDPDESGQVAELSCGDQQHAFAPPLVLQRFHEQVSARRDQPAVVCGDEMLSYGELDQASDAFAVHLLSEGMGHGMAIAVCMRRSPALVVVLLGILKAGAHFVPIASNTTPARCSEIVSLANASAIVADAFCAPNLPETDLPVIRSGGTGDPNMSPPPLPDGETLSYVLFTSGSTGAPKGVMVDHEGLARYISWAAEEFGGGLPADYPLFSSIAFDLTITSIFAPLTTGGKIVVYPEHSQPDLAVLEVFKDDLVDIVKLTPSHLTLACEAGQKTSRIRTLILGGENLRTQLCRKTLSELSPDLRIINEYGPTEAVVGCMSHQFDPDRDRFASVPIGRPAHAVKITVRDAALNLVPFGVTGEICIGGRLSKGYFQRPDLTARAFVSDPCEPDKLLYRTGDLGRLRKDGNFEYLGRKDRQLKVNGVRIEPAEIEAAILAAPGVRAAYVQTGEVARLGQKEPRRCARCGITDNVPGVVFSEADTCNVCVQFDAIKDGAMAYFEAPATLSEKITRAGQKRGGDYDAIMLLSGGKDSTYAAYRLAELTPRVLALTLDNGFLSDEAKSNIRRVAGHLGWDHRFLSTDAMNSIFVDSLKTFSNVCQGCFKTIYTLALRVARDEGVPIIVTGLSRGQFFETRLTPDLFAASCPTTAELEDMVLRARKSYHEKEDAISKLLDTRDISEGGLLDRIEFVDLYRYIDIPVSEIYRFLEKNTPWIRPSDTGRSTNCKINDVGIFVHKKREGFHNYALPYSWDVRMGHKTREQALEELDDEIDETRVHAILEEIGFDDPIEEQAGKSTLVAYAAVSSDEAKTAIWDEIIARLPREMHPAQLVTMERLPMTENGKVDTDLLPIPVFRERRVHTATVAPRSPEEHTLAAIFEDVLGIAGLGVHDNFFDLGGDSLAAIRIAIKANEVGLTMPATAIFTYQTVARLAVSLGEKSGTVTAQEDTDETDNLLELDEADLNAIKQIIS